MGGREGVRGLGGHPPHQELAAAVILQAVKDLRIRRRHRKPTWDEGDPAEFLAGRPPYHNILEFWSWLAGVYPPGVLGILHDQEAKKSVGKGAR